MTPRDAPFVLGRRVALLYRNLLLGQVVSVINATFLTWIAWATVDRTLLGLWWGAAVAVALARLAVARRFDASSPDERAADLTGWHQRARTGAAIGGLVWAGGTLLLMLGQPVALQLFTAFVMAGMVAGAVPVLAADRLAFRFYAWPLALAVAFSAMGSDPMHIAFSAMSLLFLLASTRSADYFHQTLEETFRLEHEKDALVTRLEAATLVAEQSARAKTEFLANVSHELRTPMNGIIGFADLLASEPLTDDQQAMLVPLRESADHLLTLINHLIELSALEAGHLRLESAPFAPADLLDSLANAYRRRAESRGLHLSTRRDGTLPPILEGDVTRLRQLFDHLVDNAIKFTPQGDIVLSMALAGETDGQARIRFMVEDTGCGMTPDAISRLDDLLVQGDGSSARQHGGMGLGLAIVRALLRRMDGSPLTIESEAGRGSRFSFVLSFAIPPMATC